MDISLKEFIEDGWKSQQSYAEAAGIYGPYDIMAKPTQYQMIINNLGHMMEEVVEARREVVRRPWKVEEVGCLDNAEKRSAFIEEMFDVLLFFRATLAYAGISGDEFVEVAAAKLHYNSIREDHKTNVA
jgi:hypothetical protein